MKTKRLDFGAEHDDFHGFMPTDGHDITLFHNAEGDAKPKINPDDVKALKDTISGFFKREKHPSCGKKPRKFSITPRGARRNKAKREKWNKCVEKYELAKLKAANSSSSKSDESPSNNAGKSAKTTEETMSLTSKIGIGVGIFTLVGGIIYLAVKS